MEELTDLVMRAQAGDLEAFNEIVGRFQNMAVTYAFSKLGDFHLAQDAAQDAFIGAYLNLRQLKEPIAFSSWFRRLVLTQCDRFTRRKRIPTVALSQADGVPEGDGNPAVLFDKHNRREAVFGAIEELRQEERVVVLLFYFAGHSQLEIASFLDLPVSTINNRLFSARKRLREELKNMTARKQQTYEDPKLSAKVKQSLGVIEKLHRKLADLMASLISDGLPNPAQVEVISATQVTYVDFIESLGNPACAFTFRLEPTDGRITFNFPMQLVWALLAHLDHPESAERWEREQTIVWEEISPISSLFLKTAENVEVTWSDLIKLSAEDGVVDTNPLVLLGYPENRSAEPLETVVHVTLQLESDGLSDQLSLCYPPGVLRALLARLG